MENIKDTIIYKMWNEFPNLSNDNINLIANRIEDLFNNKKENVDNILFLAKSIVDVFTNTIEYKASESTSIIGPFVAFVVRQIEKIETIVDAKSFKDITNKEKFGNDLLNIFHTASCFDSNVNICKTSYELINCLDAINMER